MPMFEKLRDECLNNGTLFEDPDFPANDSVLYFVDDKPITWKRPTDIVENPVFIREATYYDLNQGAVGDCFFLAAVNSLMANDKKMLETNVPRDQGFKEKYAGIFHFNFWQFGDWKEIVIDDRLPVKDGKLVYSKNLNEPDEFWSCLLEKAFAKLNGSYKNIDGGFPGDALVDLTGGVSEMILLKECEYNDEELFKILYKMWRMDTLVSSCIFVSEGGIVEERRDNGLLEGHAYSVTRMAMVNFSNRTERLLRLRNPWGAVEWNGAWSDKSSEWSSFSEEDRKKIGLIVRDEGEFWMRLEDVMTEFDSITFCHQNESAFCEIVSDPDAQKLKWTSHTFKDRWVKFVSSGGRDVESDIYWKNPQFIIDLDHQTEHTWAVISLMEIMSTDSSSTEIRTAFDIYKLKPGVKIPSSYRFDKEAVRLLSFSRLTNMRESSRCFELPPGVYVVIVYNKEMATCEFLLRIYLDCVADVRPADDVTVPFTDEEKAQLLDPIQLAFDKYCDKKEKNIDARAMKFLIQDVWRSDFQMELNITLESVRCIMAFADPNHFGMIGIKAVRKACKTILTWTKVFKTFDKNNSQSIETAELVNMLNVLNLSVGRKVAESAAIRYGGRDGRINFDDFFQLICRFFCIGFTYTKLDLSKAGIPVNEYVSEIMKI